MQFQYTLFITKNQQIQKSTSECYNNKLLMCMCTFSKPPPQIEAHQKGSLKDFIPWTYLRGFTVYTNI